ncbi:ankyrin repeat-containing domain protein [Rhodocollybia butyracea]|uniref:Ankyrin repeat-containing domain protein n=1 Tax=Rhodocollybia butyracea TaxID=206335 RepID=A0A9P5PC58_9AGAR|nr:ankyrin repeat-containing domain protein [Rhodocollybia butyracea]
MLEDSGAEHIGQLTSSEKVHEENTEQPKLRNYSAGQPTSGDLDMEMSVDDLQLGDNDKPLVHSSAEKGKKGNPEQPRLGIKPYRSIYSDNRSYNYEEKYPPDTLGEEITENARVWKVYLDEAEQQDDEMLKGFTDTITSLLVFAALFSAVVTAFPDYSEISAALLMEQVQLLRAAGNTTAIQNIPALSRGTNSTRSTATDIWVNGLFLASLSLSLATALLSVLVQQWLQAYTSLPTGNAQERALIRQFRFTGFKKWKVPEIIGTLPLILHASLALFFVGLSLYISQIHQQLSWIVVVITILVFVIYVGSIFLPPIWIGCPYRIPLLFTLASYLLHSWMITKWAFAQSLHKVTTGLEDSAPFPIAIVSLRLTEKKFFEVPKSKHLVLADILNWLWNLESNQSIQRITAQALNGILKLELSIPKFTHDQEAIGLQPQTFDLRDVYADRCLLQSWENVVWDSLALLKVNDDYDIQIWPSIISTWRTLPKWSHWPNLDRRRGHSIFMTALNKNNTVAIERIITLIDISQYSSNNLPYIQEAAQRDLWDIVKLLVKNNADINAPGGSYGNALGTAVYKREWEIAQFLIQNGADVNAGAQLNHAAYIERWDVVQFLVENGADVAVVGGSHKPALESAVDRREWRIAKLLIAKGADISILIGQQSVNHRSAVGVAARNRDWALVTFLVESGAPANAMEETYGTALAAAAYWGKHAHNLNIVGRYGTALGGAAHSGHMDIVNYLLANGADMNISGRKYGTALAAAAHGREWDIIKCLIQYGADINRVGGEYGTVLGVAAYLGSLNIVEFLLEKGADVNTVGGEYGTALGAAAYWGNLDTVKFLVANGADIRAVGGEYETALGAAAHGREWDIAMFLVEEGADVNMIGGEYGTALGAAVHGGAFNIVKFLLERGADVNMSGAKFQAPLGAAAHVGAYDMIELLVKNGADINRIEGKYGTVLGAAAHRGELDVARFLVESGADVNVVGGIYGTALGAAAHGREWDMVIFLVKHGADVNRVDGEFGTALGAAAYWGKLDTVVFLLENGADVNTLGGKYGTALGAAVHGEAMDVVELLLESGAQRETGDFAKDIAITNFLKVQDLHSPGFY